jgi:hypothetical protein
MTAAFSPNWFKYRRLSEMPQQTVRFVVGKAVITNAESVVQELPQLDCLARDTGDD